MKLFIQSAWICACDTMHTSMCESTDMSEMLDVLDAEQEVLDAKAALIRARRDRVVFSYQLAVNVGGLAPQSLGLNLAVPDYVASYESAGDKIFSTEPTYKP